MIHSSASDIELPRRGPREHSASPEELRTQERKVVVYKDKSKGFIRRHPILTALGIGALLIYFGMGAARGRHDEASSKAFKGILDTTGAGRLFGRPDGFRARTLGPGTGPVGPSHPGRDGNNPF